MPPTIVVSGLVKPVGLRVRAAEALVLQRDGKILAVDIAAATHLAGRPGAGEMRPASISQQTGRRRMSLQDRRLVAVGLAGGVTQPAGAASRQAGARDARYSFRQSARGREPRAGTAARPSRCRRRTRRWRRAG